MLGKLASMAAQIESVYSWIEKITYQMKLLPRRSPHSSSWSSLDYQKENVQAIPFHFMVKFFTLFPVFPV